LSKPAPAVPPPRPRYTPVEQRIVDALSDGEAHLADGLVCCLHDELGGRLNLRAHVSNIRKKLPPGEYLVCEFRSRQIFYRHVILLSSRNSSGNGKP
jgi:hypothetical protein